MPTSDAQKRATAKHRKQKAKQVGITFFPPDMDLYEYLKAQPNMSGYVKALIRADMERNQ